MHDAVEFVEAPFIATPIADDATQPLAGRLGLDRHVDRLALQARQSRRFAHRLQQFLGMPGLRDVLIDAGDVDAGDDVLRVGVAGDDDANRVGPEVANALEELDAGFAGHALIAQDDLHHFAGEHRLGLGGVARADDLEFVGEHAAQRFDRAHFVVDDEDGGLRGHRTLAAGSAGARNALERWTASVKGVRDFGDLADEIVARDVIARIEAVEVALHARELLLPIRGERLDRFVLGAPARLASMRRVRPAPYRRRARAARARIVFVGAERGRRARRAPASPSRIASSIPIGRRAASDPTRARLGRRAWATDRSSIPSRRDCPCPCNAD